MTKSILSSPQPAAARPGTPKTQDVAPDLTVPATRLAPLPPMERVPWADAPQDADAAAPEQSEVKAVQNTPQRGALGARTLAPAPQTERQLVRHINGAVGVLVQAYEDRVVVAIGKRVVTWAMDHVTNELAESVPLSQRIGSAPEYSDFLIAEIFKFDPAPTDYVPDPYGMFRDLTIDRQTLSLINNTLWRSFCGIYFSHRLTQEQRTAQRRGEAIEKPPINHSEAYARTLTVDVLTRRNTKRINFMRGAAETENKVPILYYRFDENDMTDLAYDQNPLDTAASFVVALELAIAAGCTSERDGVPNLAPGSLMPIIENAQALVVIDFGSASARVQDDMFTVSARSIYDVAKGTKLRFEKDQRTYQNPRPAKDVALPPGPKGYARRV